MDQSMSPRKYLAALAVGMITDSWAAQRTILKVLRSVDIIDGKGCVEINKGEMVEFERLLTNPFVVCIRPIGQQQCFWTSPFAISPQPRKR